MGNINFFNRYFFILFSGFCVFVGWQVAHLQIEYSTSLKTTQHSKNIEITQVAYHDELKYEEQIMVNSFSYNRMPYQKVYFDSSSYIKIWYAGKDRVALIIQYQDSMSTRLYQEPWVGYGISFSFKNHESWERQSISNIDFFANKCLSCHYGFNQEYYWDDLKKFDNLSTPIFKKELLKIHEKYNINEVDSIIYRYNDADIQSIHEFIKLLEKKPQAISCP